MGTEAVRIAGAGLSGLSTAIGLARLGHRVDVFEKNTDSGMLRHADWDAIESGRIWVESEGKGSGSMFCFTLPVKE
jgi:flavin-dependent dehydrogenase